MLYNAFIPFGEIVSVLIPPDNATGKNRGFGFVQFEEEEDAEAAIENRDGSELLGRVLRCNVAREHKIKLGSHKAVWAAADEWYQNNLKEGDEGAAAAK